jgi:ABC-type multidrug transport system ATPase subunit
VSLESNAVTALVGSNGSGKTTFIKVLLNELINYSGNYSIDNALVKDLTGSLLYRFGIGYAPEHAILDEQLSGYEILYIVKEIHNIDQTIFDTCINEYHQFLQLESWFDAMPCKEYSQGMRKKVSLMIAFLSAANFLVIDEPTNGLDPLAVFGVKKLLSRCKDQGRGVLISSHILDFIEKIAQNIIILKKGSIVFAGSVKELLDNSPGKSLDEIYYDIFTNIATHENGSIA